MHHMRCCKSKVIGLSEAEARQEQVKRQNAKVKSKKSRSLNILNHGRAISGV
jgi:protein-arginine kinase